MFEMINIKELAIRVKPIVNRGPHTTEDEVIEAFRPLGNDDFKNTDIYFGGSMKTPTGIAILQVTN